MESSAWYDCAPCLKPCAWLQVIDEYPYTKISELTIITGALTIRDTTALTSLGTMSLEEVQGKLYIYRNQVLTSISGMGELREVGGDFEVNNEVALEEIALPLERGAFVARDVAIVMLDEREQQLRDFRPYSDSLAVAGDLAVVDPELEAAT